MSASLAESLSRDYLNRVAQQSSVHTLMDFFCNDQAKQALHNPAVDMKQICLNYQSHRPELATTVRESLARRGNGSFAKILAPVRPLNMATARQFSSYNR